MFSILVAYFYSPYTIICFFLFSSSYIFFVVLLLQFSLLSSFARSSFFYSPINASYFSLPHSSLLCPPTIALCHSIFYNPSCSSSSSSSSFGFFLINSSPLRSHLHNCPFRVLTMILAGNQTCFPVFKTHRTQHGNAIMSIPLCLVFMTAAFCAVGTSYL